MVNKKFKDYKVTLNKLKLIFLKNTSLMSIRKLTTMKMLLKTSKDKMMS